MHELAEVTDGYFPWGTGPQHLRVRGLQTKKSYNYILIPNTAYLADKFATGNKHLYLGKLCVISHDIAGIVSFIKWKEA